MRRAIASLLTVLGTLGGASTAAGPEIHLVEREQLTLRVGAVGVRLLDVDGGGLVLDVGEAGSAEATLRVAWPDPDAPSRLRLRAERSETPAGQRVRVVSVLSRPGQAAPVTATREIAVGSEPETALFEVARVGDRVLTLVLTAEVTRVTEYTARPVIGRPVTFQIDIDWVEQGSSETLETNQLNTFVGQSVSYSFSLGKTGEAEALALRLLPLRIVGDTLRVEVDVSGTLPDADGQLVIVSRQEQWLSSRDTTSTLDLSSGEPPSGFRFVVTPRF